jgi:hypothetical protein
VDPAREKHGNAEPGTHAGREEEAVALGVRPHLGGHVANDLEIHLAVRLRFRERHRFLGSRRVGLAGEGDHPERGLPFVELRQRQQAMGQHRLDRVGDSLEHLAHVERLRESPEKDLDLLEPLAAVPSASQIVQCWTADPRRAAIGRRVRWSSSVKARVRKALNQTPPLKASPDGNGSHITERVPPSRMSASLGKAGSSSARASSIRGFGPGRGRIRGDQDVKGIGPPDLVPLFEHSTVVA